MKAKTTLWRSQIAYDKRLDLPPLAIGAACALFISMFIIMGLLYLQRIERSLVTLLENQGRAITEVLQRLSQENLNLLVQAGQQQPERPYSLPQEQPLYPKSWLTSALAELGQEVDKKWLVANLNEEAIKKFAQDKGLWLVALMDKHGKVVFQNRRLPAAYLFAGENESQSPLTIERLLRLAQLKKIGYIALQRKDGSGTVIIALDRGGLLYWGLKVSVEKAIEKLGEGQRQGLVYITITNVQGMPLGYSGYVPERWHVTEMPFIELLRGSVKLASRSVRYLNRNVIDMAIPFYINGKIVGIVRIGMDKESTDRILRDNKRQLLSFLIFVMLITIFSMWTLYHNHNRHMARIVEIERSLEKAERLSSLGQLAAGVAHEIRNPLNAISMASQRLKRDFSPAAEEYNREFQMLCGVIRDEIRRLNGIVEEFLSFSKSRRRLELHNYPVTEVLQKIVNLTQEEARSKEISIRTRGFANQQTLPMDMDKLQQALLNFVKNAMESIKGAGEIEITMHQRDRDFISITVSDTGCGMTAAEIERIFNPEYTTKEKGVGLGLALAHEIIRGHGGEIRISSTPNVGSDFEIRLPIKKRSAEGAVRSVAKTGEVS
ncbi:MAG: ATP-binding protein [Syntrophales bacterium]